MSYESDLARFASRVADMISEPPRLNAADLPIADAARLAIRRWCRQVLADLAPNDMPRDTGLANLATNPVGTLRRLLEVDPEPFGGADPTNVAFDRTVVSDGGQQWKTLRVEAVLVAHGWASATPETRPDGDARWSVIADVAAIAEAAAMLDRDLARLHPRAAESGSAQHRIRDTWEIVAVAEHVRHHAARGALPPPEPLRSSRLLPLRVQSPEGITPALGRLAELIADARHLRPETVSALAGAHWRTMLALAETIEARTSPADSLAKAMRVNAAALRRMQQAAREVVSIDHPDPRPMRQANQIRRVLTDAEQHPAGTRTAAILLQAVRPALEVVPALRAAIEKEVDAGRWYTRTQPGSTTWAPTNSTADFQLRATARRVAERTQHVLEKLPEQALAVTALRSPRAVLNTELLNRDRQRAAIARSP